MSVHRITSKTVIDDEITEAPRYGLLRVSVLAIGTFVVGTDAFIVSAFLPSMAGDLSISLSAAGQSVTMFALAYAFLAPVISTLTGGVPRRRLLVLALFFLGLANLGSALSPSLGLLIVTRIAAAAAAAAYTPTAGAVAAAMVRPELRARALAVVIGGLTTATALGVPLGRIVSEALSWRAALISVGALSFAAAIGVLSTMPRHPSGASVSISERLAVLRHRGVLIILPLTILGMTACYVPYAFTVPLLNDLLGSSQSVTTMLLLYGAGAILGNYISGSATDRIGSGYVLMGAYLLMIAALGGMALLVGQPVSIYSPILVGFLMMCWGASSWMQTPAQQHRLILSSPKEANLVVSLNSSAIYIGISAGTFIGSNSITIGSREILVFASVIAFISFLYAAYTLLFTE